MGEVTPDVSAELLRRFQASDPSRSNATADQMFSAVFTVPPLPATSAPPAVAATSDKGSNPRYALSDHTHQSSVQRQRVAVTLNGSTGKGTWTFPTAYPAGVVPVVQTTVETPDGATYALDAKLVAGSVSNTGCTIIVNKINQSVTLPGLATSLLGFVVGILQPATGTVTVHCWAGSPA